MTKKLLDLPLGNMKTDSPTIIIFNLYLEVLLVTDKTIYQNHQVYANTIVKNLVFLHMRSYFSHYMNGVNERYSNALRYDPDIRINILLTNLLFLTVREF